MDIAAFEEKLLEKPAKVDAILFIGGSKFLDVVHYADRLLEIGAQPTAIGVLVGTDALQPKTQPYYYNAIWSLLEKYVIGTPTRQSITLP
jgi:hypothetical protein